MPDIFQLADVAKITGLALNKIQQWTLGRPYRIRASIRLSSKRGVPKLFSADDLLKFVVVKQLTQDGFMSRVIKVALNKLDSFNTHAETLLIASGQVHFVDLIPSDMVARVELDKKISTYILNLGRLRVELNRKIAARAK